jgi:phage RecT family recombinase
MTTEIAKKDTAGSIVSKMQGQFAKVLPKIITPERYCRIMLTALNKDKHLMAAISDPRNQASVLSAFMRCAEMGLEPDGRRAAIVCYKRGNTGMYDVTLIPMFQGLAELAMRSGEISTIHAEKVCNNDEFEWDLGRVVKHVPNWKEDRGKAYLYYCHVVFKDGAIKDETMSKLEVEEIMKRSSAYQGAKRYGKSCPWMTDFEEMAKKGLACDTPILTSVGWNTMGEVEVGDEVFDMDGNCVAIIATSEVKHLPCFRITFSNGEQIICDNEHRWVCGIGPNAARDQRTMEILDMYDAHRQGKSISVPVAAALNNGGDDINAATEAYLLGYWLGNGNNHNATVTCHKDDVDELSAYITASPYTLGAIRPDKRSEAVSIGIKDGFKQLLSDCDLLKNKHIPLSAILWSKEERIALVRGLMDSDGCIEKERGRAVFTTTDSKMAEEFLSLIHSLGEIAHKRHSRQSGFGKTVDCYYVEWQPACFVPASLSRKVKKTKQRKLKNYRSIKLIEKIESVPTKCIAVDSPTKTYLAGKTLVPTHNTVFRRCSKWLPLSPELRSAIEADDADYVDTAGAIHHSADDKFAQSVGVASEPAVDAEVIPETEDVQGDVPEGGSDLFQEETRGEQ